MITIQGFVTAKRSVTVGQWEGYTFWVRYTTLDDIVQHQAPSQSISNSRIQYRIMVEMFKTLVNGHYSCSGLAASVLRS